MDPIISAPAFAAASGGDIAPPQKYFSAAFGAVALADLRSALGQEGSFMVLGIGGAGGAGRLIRSSSGRQGFGGRIKGSAGRRGAGDLQGSGSYRSF